MEINASTPEAYVKDYNRLKEEMLLPDDIILMKEITDGVSKFPTITTSDELVELESNLATLSFRLAGLIGRLSSQYEVKYRNIKKKVSDKATEIMKAGEKGGYARATELADASFTDERIALSVMEGVVDEYKGKSYALKDIFLAITHRIHKFNKNL